MQSGNGIVQRGYKFRLDWEAVISENNENWLNKNDNSESYNPGWFLFPRNLQLANRLEAGLFPLAYLV